MQFGSCVAACPTEVHNRNEEACPIGISGTPDRTYLLMLDASRDAAAHPIAPHHHSTANLSDLSPSVPFIFGPAQPH